MALPNHMRLRLTRTPHKHHGLIDYIIQHLGRVPVPMRVLHSRVVDDYGPINERVFYYYLRVLRETGKIKAVLSEERLGYHPTYLYTRP